MEGATLAGARGVLMLVRPWLGALVGGTPRAGPCVHQRSESLMFRFLHSKATSSCMFGKVPCEAAIGANGTMTSLTICMVRWYCKSGESGAMLYG